MGALPFAPTASMLPKLEHDPKSGNRFSDKIMLKTNNLDRDPIQLNWITVWCELRNQQGH